MEENRPAHPFHTELVWPLLSRPIVLVRSQFAQAQDKSRSNLNSCPVERSEDLVEGLKKPADSSAYRTRAANC